VYKLHGIDGLLNKSGTYSGEFKETVLEYMKQNQLSLTETARYFKIPAVSTVTQWRNLAEKEGRSSLYEERRGQHFKMTPKKKKTAPAPEPAPNKKKKPAPEPEEDDDDDEDDEWDDV
jgi:transposase